MNLQIVRTLHPPEIYLAQLARLNEQMGFHATANDIRHRLGLLPRQDRLLLATDDDALIGYAHLRVAHDLIAAESAEVVAIVVDPSYRRRGVGRRLITAAEAWATESGRSRLVLRTNVVSTAAHAFYVAMGYEQAETSLVFIRSLQAQRTSEEPTRPPA